MGTVLGSPTVGRSANLPTGLRRGLALADTNDVFSPSAFRARLSYIGAAFVISGMLMTWGMSLVALGANNTHDSRVFAASLVVFGVISCFFCVIVLFRLAWFGFKAQFAQRATEQEECRAATTEASTWIETLNSLYSDEKLGQDIAARLRDVEGVQLLVSGRVDRVIAEETMRAVRQRIRERDETLGQLLAS